MSCHAYDVCRIFIKFAAAVVSAMSARGLSEQWRRLPEDVRVTSSLLLAILFVLTNNKPQGNSECVSELSVIVPVEDHESPAMQLECSSICSICSP